MFAEGTKFGQETVFKQCCPILSRKVSPWTNISTFIPQARSKIPLTIYIPNAKSSDQTLGKLFSIKHEQPKYNSRFSTENLPCILLLTYLILTLMSRQLARSFLALLLKNSLFASHLTSMHSFTAVSSPTSFFQFLPMSLDNSLTDMLSHRRSELTVCPILVYFKMSFEGLMNFNFSRISSNFSGLESFLWTSNKDFRWVMSSTTTPLW